MCVPYDAQCQFGPAATIHPLPTFSSIVQASVKENAASPETFSNLKIEELAARIYELELAVSIHPPAKLQGRLGQPNRSALSPAVVRVPGDIEKLYILLPDLPTLSSFLPWSRTDYPPLYFEMLKSIRIHVLLPLCDHQSSFNYLAWWAQTVVPVKSERGAP